MKYSDIGQVIVGRLINPLKEDDQEKIMKYVRKDDFQVFSQKFIFEYAREKYEERGYILEAEELAIQPDLAVRLLNTSDRLKKQYGKKKGFKTKEIRDIFEEPMGPENSSKEALMQSAENLLNNEVNYDKTYKHDIMYYIEKLKEIKKINKIKNTLNTASQKLNELIDNGEEYSVEKVFPNGIKSILPQSNIDNKSFWDIVEEIRDQARNGGIVPFYFDQYDERFLNGGFREGQLGITGANTGVGKTTFGTNVFYRQIINGKNVFYLTLEESRKELMQRLAVIHSNYSEKFENLKVTKQEWSDMGLNSDRMNKINEILQDMEQYGFEKKIIDMSGDKYYNSVMTQLMNLSIRKRQGEKIAMVHIDHIHNMKKRGSGGKAEKTGDIADGMMSFAKESGIVIHLLAQLNPLKDDEKPKKEQIRWSADFAQNGYIVNLLYRKDYGLTKEEREEQGLLNEKTIEIIVDKNRISGEMGSIELYIDWKYDYMATIGTKEEELLQQNMLEQVEDLEKRKKKIEEEGTTVQTFAEARAEKRMKEKQEESPMISLDELTQEMEEEVDV